MTNGSLMKVKSIAECSILQYFWPALTNNWSWKKQFSGFLKLAVLRRFYCKSQANCGTLTCVILFVRPFYMQCCRCIGQIYRWLLSDILGVVWKCLFSELDQKYYFLSSRSWNRLVFRYQDDRCHRPLKFQSLFQLWSPCRRHCIVFPIHDTLCSQETGSQPPPPSRHTNTKWLCKSNPPWTWQSSERGRRRRKRLVTSTRNGALCERRMYHFDAS